MEAEIGCRCCWRSLCDFALRSSIIGLFASAYCTFSLFQLSWMGRSGKLSIDLRVEPGVIDVVVDVDAGCNGSLYVDEVSSSLFNGTD